MNANLRSLKAIAKLQSDAGKPWGPVLQAFAEQWERDLQAFNPVDIPEGVSTSVKVSANMQKIAVKIEEMLHRVTDQEIPFVLVTHVEGMSHYMANIDRQAGAEVLANVAVTLLDEGTTEEAAERAANVMNITKAH